MSARSRIICLAGALAALVAFLVLRGWIYDYHIGMTEIPCAEDGLPITGSKRDDWAQLCFYRRANARLLKSGAQPKIVMIGDSITADWPTPGREFVNRGIRAQTSSQVMLRFQQDAIALHPRVIHLLVGINDVTGNAGPVSADMFENNIRAMVEMAQAHDIEVILGTIGPATDFDRRPHVKRGYWVPVLNDWLAQYAREQHLVLADYHAVLAHPGGRMREELFKDTVHPNERGYAAMQRILFEAIARTRMAAAKSGLRQSRSAQ